MSLPPRPAEPIVRTELAGLPAPKRGKVRDVYDLGSRLLIVATDRLSAYDHVLSPGIPDKGKILHQMSVFWFERLGTLVPNHLLDEEWPEVLRPHASLLKGRAALVRKARVVPFECVARGYLAGSGYREYVEGGTVCGLPLPPGLVRASRLPEPIFTPATKAEEGHDENVPFERMADALGSDLSGRLRDLTLALYSAAAEHAAGAGLILADTKFEFGLDEAGEILWIDEAATPDSSRYWDAATWEPGREPASFDKQYVRNWLDASGWDHQSPPPTLPEDVVAGTRDRYLEAFRRVVGREPEL